MAGSAVRKGMTVAEYLAFERASKVKHEYVDGEVFAMVGGTRRHSLIASNVGRILGNLLKTGPCEVYQSDMRVKVEASDLYTYPDVSIACAERRFEDGERTLLTPVALVEVLSPTTADWDRGGKATHYRTVPTVRDILLVAQDRPFIEHFARQTDGSWILRAHTDGVVRLSGIEADLPLAEIYLKAFDEAAG